jgi:C-terminal processing protease CtpA/Prc
MKHKHSRLVGTLIAVLVLAACTPAAPVPAPTPVPPTPAAAEPTPVPPTAEPVAAVPTTSPTVAEAEAAGVTLVCNTGPSFDECGGPESVGGEAKSANFAFMPSLYPEPTVVLIDVSTIIGGRPEVFVPELGQILGTFTQPLFPGPGQFLVNLPINPTATTIDLDNDGTDDPGVQIYALRVASNIINDSYLQQLEQIGGLTSYIPDVTTGTITEGSFLLYAREAGQGFPAAWGEDETWFTADDPMITLPVGYTLATLAADGSVTLDRSSSVAMDTIERAEAASPDFADQGILESFNSLIDVLNERYAYTELRGLDWEAIRAEYLPAVTQADADEDFTAYYQTLNELAISLQDSHVSVTANFGAAQLASIRAFSEQVAGNVGVSTVAVSDESGAISEQVQVVTVGAGTPAAEAGLVPGTAIVSVDGLSTAERLSQVPLLNGIGTPEVRLATQARLLLNFPIGQSVTVGYRLPESAEVLTATLDAGEYDTGAMTPPAGDSTPISYEQLGNYALVRWSSFINYVLPKIAVLEEALAEEQNRETGGVILDLRGNGGGWVTLYETMVSYFFTADDPMRQHVFDFYRYDAEAGEHVRDMPVDYLLSAPRPDLPTAGRW